MATYYIATDACACDIDAESLDAAAAGFAADEGIRGIATVDDLAAYFERVGGWITISDADGATLVEVE
jgi:hypothetical protein